MRILVITVVHHPLDARIHRRQIGALTAAGLAVTYAAPWSAFGVTPPTGIESHDLPRSSGRRRLAAVRAAGRLVDDIGAAHDLVLLHDPELLGAVRRFTQTPVVLDVHEDTAAALVDRPWVPSALVPVTRWGVTRAERWAERHVHVMLAEAGYAARFEARHPIVPNVPVVPSVVSAPGRDRVVHVGRISRGRGWEELRDVAALLVGRGVRVELFGPADADVEADVRAADVRGDVVWHGFVRNEEALARIDGALAGLCLLHDLPNYRHSLPTKAVEYLAAGIPAVTTPLPLARDLIESSGGGVVVPFQDASAAAAAVARLRDDDALRTTMGADGHAHAFEHLNWDAEATRFVDLLRGWASGSE